MVPDIAVGHVGSGVVSEDAEALLHAADILWCLVDQKVDVLRETARPVRRRRQKRHGTQGVPAVAWRPRGGTRGKRQPSVTHAGIDASRKAGDIRRIPHAPICAARGVDIS